MLHQHVNQAHISRCDLSKVQPIKLPKEREKRGRHGQREIKMDRQKEGGMKERERESGGRTGRKREEGKRAGGGTEKDNGIRSEN